jgi:hypothetical protein
MTVLRPDERTRQQHHGAGSEHGVDGVQPVARGDGFHAPERPDPPAGRGRALSIGAVAGARRT